MPTIVGVRDSSGSYRPVARLLARKPADFSVLTGEDALLFFTMMANGARGGILAANHVMAARFVRVIEAICGERPSVPVPPGHRLAGVVPLLFAEAWMPIRKYLLWRQGLIAWCRLPLTRISRRLATARCDGRRAAGGSPQPQHGGGSAARQRRYPRRSGQRALALNNDHAGIGLDGDRLAELVGRAFVARRIGAADTFLLAFDQDAAYDSPNFLWFRSRYRLRLCRPGGRRAGAGDGARLRPPSV